MAKVELTDEEIVLLIEILDKVSVPGKIARTLVGLIDKINVPIKEEKPCQ